MPTWFAKAAVQGATSCLPARDSINRRLQRPLELTGRASYLMRKWRIAEKHLEYYRHHRGAQLPGRCLELGTGLYPIVPVGLALSGVPEVITIDVKPLMTDEAIRTIARGYLGLVENGAIPRPVTDMGKRRLVALYNADTTSGARTLQELGIVSMVGDVAELALPEACVDLAVSNNTLEHIPPADLASILRELRRVATVDGLMTHLVDLADHYSYFDGSIDVYNFLKYSERVWKIFNNNLHYQSRLRIPAYRELLAQTGWSILHEQSRRKSADLLPVLAEPFRAYEEADLLVYRSWLVAAPA